MSLEEIEQRIYEYYQFFHMTAPHVRVREEGQLAQLWRMFDMHVHDPVE